MTPTLTATPDRTGALRDLLDGELVTPADPEWDEARLAWNLAADQRPSAVVFAESVDDVVAVVDYARDRGLHVTTQGTGHFANTLDSFTDTILLKTSRLRGVESFRRDRDHLERAWSPTKKWHENHGSNATVGQEG